VLGLLAVFILTGANTSTKYNDFAICLAEKGAKMYGASWCTHCKDQKREFGASWQYVTYIECSNPDHSQTAQCAQAGIKGYPTWEFADGTRQSGALPFELLSQKTGCELPP
jgi:hypothetical protein